MRTPEESMELRSRTLEAVNRILHEAITCDSEEQLGRACLAVAEELTASALGFLGELDGRGRLDHLAVSESGWAACRMTERAERRPIVDLEVRGIYGRALREGKSLYTNDPASHPDRVGLPGGHAPIRSFLGVPLTVRDRVIGIVALANREGGYGDVEQRAVEAIAPAIVEALLRKRAELRVRESEAMLARAQEIAHLGSWELDLRHDRLWWSDEVYRIFGLERAGFGASYQAFLEAVHPEDRAAVDAAYSGSLRDGLASYEIEHRVVRRSTGEVRIVHEKCQHVRDASGRIVRSIGMVHDITERRQAEAEHQRRAEALAEANEAKDLFLSTLSHELRTPLAAMLSSIEVLNSPGASGEQRARMLAILERNVRHQRRLIDDLLDLSRIIRGKVAIARDALDLRDVVSAQVEAAEGSARNERLALAIELCEQPLAVVGDAIRLGQVVSNLLANAVKFTAAGGRISVRTLVEGGCAVVRVRDSGSGIEPAHLRHLFEPFWQARAVPARGGSGVPAAASAPRGPESGLGIGLAIARSLAELHGGTLEAASDGIGRGSELTLRLPLRGEDASASAARSRAGAEAPSLRVLVVEDCPDLRESLVVLVELMGHVVRSAASGQAAIDAILRERPDVALVDIGLPDMDGYELARRVRADRGLNTLRLIALTGYATPEHRERSLAAGFDLHLAKPVDADELALALSERLG